MDLIYFKFPYPYLYFKMSSCLDPSLTNKSCFCQRQSGEVQGHDLGAPFKL